MTHLRRPIKAGCRLGRLAGLATVLTAVLLISAGPAGAKEAVPEVLHSWSPAAVATGDWQASPETPLQAKTANGGTSCPGTGRVWQDAAKGRTVFLRWYACDASKMAIWTAYLDDMRAQSPAEWRNATPALTKDHEVIVPAGQTGRSHARLWIQQRFLVAVQVTCERDARDVCLTLSGKAVRDVSRQLPDAPAKITGSRQTSVVTWVYSIVSVMSVGIAVAAILRRAARHTYTVPPRLTGRWFSIERDAKRQRRRARLRRFGILLIAPQVVLIAVYTPGAFAHGISVDDFTAIFAAVILSVPAIIMLAYSRSPFPDPDWRWHRAGALPRSRRIVTSVLSTTTAVALLASLLLFGLADSQDRLAAVPDVFATVASAFLVPFCLFSWLLSRALHKRQVHDAWRTLNARPGTPIVYVRNFGGADSRMRANPVLHRGIVDSFFKLFAAQRRTRFEDLLLALLAHHGPVRAVEPPWAALPKLDATTTRLSATSYLSELAEQVRSARAVVVCGTPAAVGPDDREVLRIAASQAESKPLLVVLPAYPPSELRMRFDRWTAAVSDLAPFSSLGQVARVDGTHVLLHLPGRGWFAWGAGRRDEWTYRRAIHDAVAYASAQLETGYRTGATAAEPNGAPAATPADSVRPLVTVMTAEADRAVAADIAAGLATTGLSTRVATDPARTEEDRAVVVLLSQAALHDEGWLAALERLSADSRYLVPVQCTPVVDGSVPQHLRDLNWINWTALGRLRGLADVFAAVNADPTRYQLHRDLLNQARAWAAHHRQSALLITDHRRAEQAALHVRQAVVDGLARPNDLQYEFVQASLAAARRRRAGLRVAWISGAAVLALAAVVVSTTVPAVRLLGFNNRLTGLLSYVPVIAADRPDWAALLAGAAIVQGGDQEASIARRSLRSLLDQPWPRAFLGAGHDARMTDMTTLSNGQVLTVDVRGSVTAWNPQDGGVLWRYHIDQIASVLDAAADGSVLTIGAGTKVFVVTPSPWHKTVVDVGAPVQRLALTMDGRTLAVLTSTGHVLTVDLATHAIRDRGAFETVLAVARTADGTGVRALVANSGDAVSVLDVVSGRTGRPISVRLPQKERIGSIGPDGETVAVVRDDRQLLVGTSTSGLAPTGQLVPDGSPALLMLPNGRVVSATSQDGVRLIDVALGVTTARLVTQAGIDQLRASDDGETLLTSGGLGVAVWRTRGLASLQPPPTGGTMATVPRAATSTMSVEGNADGTVTIHPSNGDPEHLHVVNGAVTTVAIDPASRNAVVGSDSGELAEVDLDYRVVERRWTAPTAAGIAAVGWADPPDTLLVRTTDGTWWGVPACNGCGADKELLAALQQRLYGCYREDNVANVTPPVRTRLGLHVCAKSPGPKEA